MTKSENGLELAVGNVIARRVSCRAIRSNRKGVMWHQGVDLYSYQNTALKRAFDARIPPSSTSSDAEMGKLASVSGLNAYEYAFRRYQDAHYLPLIKRLKPTLLLEVGELPSLFVQHSLAGQP